MTAEMCDSWNDWILRPVNAEICGLRFEDIEDEALCRERPTASAGIIANYSLNPLAVSSVERNIKVLSEDIKDRFAVWLGRSGKYLRIMKEIVREEGLPEDIALLPLIESGFNTRAYSRSRAAGPWQFIAGTARRYGLEVSWWVDERRDPIKSTRAAARYLRDLHEMFGSWSLAMAAYNAGENKIKRALRKTGSNDYWRLLRTRHIKRETKDYVPKFIAARLIALDPEKHGITNVKYEEEFVYDEVTIKYPMTLDVIAKCAGTTVRTIKGLNPEIRRWSTPPVPAYTLRVPLGTSEAFSKNLAAIPPKKRFTVRRYKVKKGDTVWEIAGRMGVSTRAVINYNRLGRRALIRPGQVLILPTPLGKDRRVAFKDLPSVSLGSGLKGKVYTVRRGDTVSGIAERMGVSANAIIGYNKLGKRALIMAGQKLLIPAR
jgi:membrane-bound lytic murein transglycosylase D